MQKLTVKTTGEFELRDPIQDIDIGQDGTELYETSFVTQMIGLKRLEVIKGKPSQEADPHESTQNPSVGEALPTRDSEPTIKELNEKRGRGRPASVK
jgi:hypothetical protein